MLRRDQAKLKDNILKKSKKLQMSPGNGRLVGGVGGGFLHEKNNYLGKSNSSRLPAPRPDPVSEAPILGGQRLPVTLLNFTHGYQTTPWGLKLYHFMAKHWLSWGARDLINALGLPRTHDVYGQRVRARGEAPTPDEITLASSFQKRAPSWGSQHKPCCLEKALPTMGGQQRGRLMPSWTPLCIHS